ncbi:MAG: gamma-glutamyl-gamma-aminobutyrate hydrolase family protein [Acidimicrobiales bacterium]
MTSVRPVIGITAYEEDAHWGPWSERAVLVPSTYVHAVERAGGAPMVLPIQATGLDALIGRVDALVLSGGPDVDPSRYEAEAHEHTQTPRRERDAFELALVGAARGSQTPMLAICRGLQVLNVARGGTLHQHLPDVVGHSGHSPKAGEYAWHEVEVEPDSNLARIVAAPQLQTASHHHQAIAKLGTGLRVAAHADDGTIEAVEDPDLDYLIGVQWHPEVGEDLSLFTALVTSARRHAHVAV